MRFKKVALLGAGAVGSYFIWGMTGKEDINFCLVAEGDRKRRLAADGVKINGEIFKPPVVTPKEASGADLLLIATKYDSLKENLEVVRRAAGPGTTVISLLNGIDSEELISTVVDPAQILYAFMKITALRKDGEVTFNPEVTPGLVFGEKDSGEKSKRAAAVEDILKRAGLHGYFSENILSEQWEKFCLNIAYNLPQAAFDVGYGAYFDSPDLGFIRDRMEQEVRAVAKAYGIRFGELANKKNTHSPAVRFSTLQDLDNGRKTEVEMFLGVLADKAEAAGIEVPFCEYTRHAIHIREQKNEGLLNY